MKSLTAGVIAVIVVVVIAVVAAIVVLVSSNKAAKQNRTGPIQEVTACMFGLSQKSSFVNWLASSDLGGGKLVMGTLSQVTTEGCHPENKYWEQFTEVNKVLPGLKQLSVTNSLVCTHLTLEGWGMDNFGFCGFQSKPDKLLDKQDFKNISSFSYRSLQGGGKGST